MPLLASLPLRTALLTGNQLSAAVVEALAAGPARTSLLSLLAGDLQLDCDSLAHLLPLFEALQNLGISGNVGLVDPETLLAAAEAAPQLRTLRLNGVQLTSKEVWRGMGQARWGSARRRLLHFEPWDRELRRDEHVFGQP